MSNKICLHIKNRYRIIREKQLQKKNPVLYYDNRSKNSEYLLIVIAGFKEELWENVFERLHHYVPNNYDIIVVSYKDSETLRKYCALYNFSYFNNRFDSICVALNTCIKLSPNAKYIFKMDEDIFITKNCFDKLLNTYRNVKDFKLGIVGPIININGATYRYILDEYKLVDSYSKSFEYPKYDCFGEQFYQNVDVSKFLWKKTPNIDAMNKRFETTYKNQFKPAHTRFSTGFFLMSKDYYNIIGKFPETRMQFDWGAEEEILNVKYALENYAIIISLDTVVGHFCWGQHYNNLLKFYKENNDLFKYNKNI